VQHNIRHVSTLTVCRQCFSSAVHPPHKPVTIAAALPTRSSPATPDCPHILPLPDRQPTTSFTVRLHAAQIIVVYEHLPSMVVDVMGGSNASGWYTASTGNLGCVVTPVLLSLVLLLLLLLLPTAGGELAVVLLPLLCCVSFTVELVMWARVEEGHVKGRGAEGACMGGRMLQLPARTCVCRWISASYQASYQASLPCTSNDRHAASCQQGSRGLLRSYMTATKHVIKKVLQLICRF
jgi:hypothetical protein